jgi:hypothetical protein
MTRKASVTLVATVVIGVLLVPAPAGAKELQFQGGTEPLGGNPPVGMTMVGKNVEHPTRVTGFSIEVTFCPGDTPETMVESVPLNRNPTATKVNRNKKKDLTYFSWSWDLFGEYTGDWLESWQLVGGQHHKDPRVWRGKIRIRGVIPAEGGVEFACPLEGADADGFVHWEAELVQ